MLYIVLGTIVALAFVYLIINSVMDKQPSKVAKLDAAIAECNEAVDVLNKKYDEYVAEHERRLKVLEDIVTSPGDLEEKINNL